MNNGLADGRWLFKNLEGIHTIFLFPFVLLLATFIRLKEVWGIPTWFLWHFLL